MYFHCVKSTFFLPFLFLLVWGADFGLLQVSVYGSYPGENWTVENGKNTTVVGKVPSKSVFKRETSLVPASDPAVTIEIKEDGKIRSFDENGTLFVHSKEEYYKIDLFITAKSKFPIRILYKDFWYDRDEIKSSGTKRGWASHVGFSTNHWYQLDYTNIYDTSTYTFSFAFKLVHWHSRLRWRFQQKRIPGDINGTTPVPPGTTLDFSPDDRTFTVLSPKQDLEAYKSTAWDSLLPAEPAQKDNQTDDLIPLRDQPCAAHFYYEVVPKSEENIYPTVHYRCEFTEANFTDAETGSPTSVVSFRGCDTLGRCLAIYGAQEGQLKNCWHPFVENETCINCTPRRNFFPFIPVCRSSEHYEDFEETAMETTIFLPVPKATAFLPNDESTLEFLFYNVTEGDEDLDKIINARGIRMEQFEPVKILNSYLKVKCTVSAYWAARSIRFAIEVRNSSLVFLPDTGSAIHREDEKVHVQVMDIKLDRDDISRIFCISPIQNSYKFINASRPIQVLHTDEFYQYFGCSSDKSQDSSPSVTPPRFQVIDDGGTTEKIDSALGGGQNVTFTSANPLDFVCEASYPVEILHNIRSKLSASGTRTFENFHNRSTYKFRAETSVRLAYEKVEDLAGGAVFRCQSISSPCIHQSVIYYYQAPEDRKYSGSQLVSLVEESKSNTKLAPAHVQKNISAKSIWNLAPHNSPEEGCEVLFYYKKLEGRSFPGYSFFCSSARSGGWRGGKVRTHWCFNYWDCAASFVTRRQGPECWRPYVLEYNVEQRPEVVPDDLQSFYVTCTFGYDSKNKDDKVESPWANIVFFGLTPRKSQRPEIYFSLDDPKFNPSQMISIKEFDLNHYLDTQLEVTCTSSKFYATKNIFIGLEFDHGNSSSLIKTLPVTKEAETNRDFNTWVYKQRVDLTDDSLTRIYCFAGALNTYDWINASRPIVVHAGSTPKIQAGTADWDQESQRPSINFHGQSYTAVPKNSSHNNRTLTFHLNARDQSIVCDAFGFPPPLNFSWDSTNTDSPSPVTILLNKTWARSFIKFAVVHSKVGGNYTCTARNKGATSQKTVEVTVVDEEGAHQRKVVIWTMVSVSLFVLLIFAAAIFHLIQRIRREKMKRAAQAEEMRRFREGDSNAQEHQTNAHIYAMPYDKSLEIPPECIVIDADKVLGEGEFGQVFKGQLVSVPTKVKYLKQLDKIQESSPKLVAVKTLKDNPNPEEFKAILLEIKILAYLNFHENVVGLLGASTADIKKGKVSLALEYCGHGNLKNYLVENRASFSNLYDPNRLEASEFRENLSNSPYKDVTELISGSDLSTKNLLEFSLAISTGMSYLTEKNVVHGDLALRNILIDHNFQVRISDFGLACQLPETTMYVKKPLGRLPFMWMSIEALRDLKFSIQSDCWSFGIVLWEIFSLGMDPYPEFRGGDFFQLLCQGMRMGCPEAADDHLYALMQDCWQEEPTSRPAFSQIIPLLKNFLDNLTKTDDSSTVDDENDSKNDSSN